MDWVNRLTCGELRSNSVISLPKWSIRGTHDRNTLLRQLNPRLAPCNRLACGPRKSPTIAPNRVDLYGRVKIWTLYSVSQPGTPNERSYHGRHPLWPPLVVSLCQQIGVRTEEICLHKYRVACGTPGQKGRPAGPPEALGASSEFTLWLASSGKAPYDST